MGLKSYWEKRKFDATSEPKGKEKKSSKFSFVIQRHYASRLHYDFRLEIDGVLKSWAIPKGPSLVSKDKRLAVMTEDHPLEYGKFYGNIPKGNYGAGDVEIWDKGHFEPLEEGILKKDWNQHFSTQLEKGDLKFKLTGTHVNGAFALVKIGKQDENNWLLIKKSDEYALEKFDIANTPPKTKHTITSNIFLSKKARIY